MKAVCETCRQPTASDECRLCENAICDKCIMAPPHGSFSLMSKIPDDLKHFVYCRFCYDEKVEPDLLKYEETKEAAKQVYIFFKTQRKEIPLVRKSKEVFQVTECSDRDETILRLAFMSAEKGFNAVIDTEASATKKRNEGHHTHHWQGSGSPAMIDEEKLDRQFKQNQIYR